MLDLLPYMVIPQCYLVYASLTQDYPVLIDHVYSKIPVLLAFTPQINSSFQIFRTPHI